MKHVKKHLSYFFRNNSGVAVIEFALILPVLLLILLGVIEFGIYFMKEQIVQRTVSTAAAAIQQDPADGSIQMNAMDSGTSLVDYHATGNYICAKSYVVAADAKNFLCAAGDWIVSAPTTSDYVAGAPYYVALVAYVQESSFTELFKRYIPAIQISSVFKVGGGPTGAGPIFIAPVTLATFAPSPSILSYGLPSSIPNDAHTIILVADQVRGGIRGNNSRAIYRYVDVSGGASDYPIGNNSSVDYYSYSMQGMYPMSSDHAVHVYNTGQISGGITTTLTVVGYFQ